MRSIYSAVLLSLIIRRSKHGFHIQTRAHSLVLIAYTIIIGMKSKMKIKRMRCQGHLPWRLNRSGVEEASLPK